VILLELLADKLRPKCLNDVIGQTHLIGKDQILSNLIANKKLFSMVLYGNPGIGKTSIAYALVNELGCKFRMLNAVINNKSDFDVVIEEAKMYGELVLIIDEIHRMNKDKQDLLLPYIENGLIIFIGLTTSNPYYKINPAIRSRCQIFELHNLSQEELKEGIKKASKNLPHIKLDKSALESIATLSSGDFRNALNLLEMAYYSTKDFHVTTEVIKKTNTKPIVYGDKNDSGHYDLISAFQKSIRGSDVNAALYYLGRLIVIGDLDIIYRRMTVIAYEDIGLANPNMGPKVDAAFRLCERVGFPEARIILSNIVIEMALSSKSNTAYLAIENAINDIKTKNIGEMPSYLKSPYNDYKYPHNYKNALVKQTYLPENIKNAKYYIPKDTSRYEIALNEKYQMIEKFKKE